jgi:hypothetical protein
MKIKTLTIIILAVGCVSLSNVEAQNFPKQKTESIQQGKEYRYYDGEKEIKVYLQEDLVAEFNSKSNSYVKSMDPSSMPIKKAGLVNVYKISNASLKSQIKQGTLTKNLQQASNVSEVFRSDSGTLMALPGNIILTFKNGVNESQIQSLLKKYGLTLVRTNMILDKTYYIVKYKPGIAALELANQLRNESMVESSQPDWWIEFSLR